MQYIQIVTTTETSEEAQKIARALIDRRLAACVQIAGPITSVYRWKGEVETAEEWMCVAKTREDLYAEAEAAIREHHSYEVPEILGMPIEHGSASYLNWLDAELKADQQDG